MLLMPLVGFLPATESACARPSRRSPPTSPRTDSSCGYRNQEGLNADGLTGEEGTFVICTFWLVSCLAQAGELRPRPQALFDQLAGYANDLGLLAEAIDTCSGEQLGNFPRRSATSG